MAAALPTVSALPTTVCEGRAVLFTYLKFLSAYVVEVDIEGFQEAFVTRSFSAGTLMAVGAAFVLGPVFLGKDWIMRVLWLSAALCGAVGTSLMLEGWGAGYASFVVKTASLDEDGECIFAIINIILGALVAASFATKVVGLAIFGVGAIAAGYASNIAVPTYVVPFVKEQYPEMVLQDWYTYAAVGILALIGGYVFTALAFAVVDVVLGLIGAYLVADGTLELIIANELVPPDVEESIQLEDNLRYYVLALAALIFFVRSRLVEKPRGGRGGYSELIGR